MVARQSSHARDALVRRLVHTKRWLVAGSVALTGALTGLMASTLPGKTIGAPAAGSAAQTGSSGSAQSSAQASQSAEAGESPAAGEAPSAGESAPVEGAEPAQAAAEAPVVSGGS
jgi:hypothetical protein